VRRRLRVRILTHYFPPEVGAPQTRLGALAEGLAARGLDVTVHTGFPHYPEGRVAPPYRNRPLARETTAGGVRIRRSAVWPAANRGFAGRLADHLAFAGSALATAGSGGPADVVIAESPPLFLAAAAVGYARAKRAALVLHVADLWPESAVELGALRDRRAIAVANALAGFAYRHGALVVVPTEGMTAALAARGVPVRRIAPAVDVERFAGIPPRVPQAPLRLLYAGTMGLAQGLETLVAAARLAGPRRIRLTIAGGGAEAEAVRAVAHEVGHVRVAGIVPAAEIPGLYADADAGVVLLRDRPLFASALPTKLLEVLAAGRPAVLAARGESAALLTRTGAGLVVPPEDPEALAGAWSRLLADPSEAAAMGARGRISVSRDFNRDAMVDRWIDVLGAVQGARL
jgi:hypothetical protein